MGFFRLAFIGLCIAFLVKFFLSDVDPLVSLLDVKSGFYEDKVVVVVGASSGIGEYFARDMCKYGAKVILTARRVDKLNEVAKSCAGKHVPIVIPLDLTDFSLHEKYLKDVFALGKIDILFLNSGRSQRALADEIPLEDTRTLFELNYFSYISLTKLFLPQMKQARSGHIVVMSSLSGRIGTPLGSSYSSTKFALHGYYDALRAELSDFGVKVTIVCPGPVKSEIAKSVISASVDSKKQNDDDEKKMPTERCSYLSAVAISHELEEVWISPQPALAFTYMSTLMPAVWRPLIGKIGPARVAVFKEGGNIWDFGAVIKRAFKK